MPHPLTPTPTPASTATPTLASASAISIEFPDEFRVWLEYLEHADPHAFSLFQQAADIDLS